MTPVRLQCHRFAREAAIHFSSHRAAGATDGRPSWMCGRMPPTGIKDLRMKRVWKSAVAALAAACMLGAVGAAGARAGTIVTGPGGHQYEVVVDKTISWSQAKTAA